MNLSEENRNYILEYWEEIEAGRVVVSKKVYKVYKVKIIVPSSASLHIPLNFFHFFNSLN